MSPQKAPPPNACRNLNTGRGCANPVNSQPFLVIYLIPINAARQMADARQLKLQLVSKVRDNESLVSRLMEYERERLELYGELDELRNSTDTRHIQQLQSQLELLQQQQQESKGEVLQFGNTHLQVVEVEEKCRILAEREESLLAGNRELQAMCDGYCEQLRVSEQDRMQLKQELQEMKGGMSKAGEEEMDGRRSAMEVEGSLVKCGESVGSSSDGEMVEGLEKALEEAKAAEVQLGAALRCLSGKVARTERESARLEMVVDEAERVQRDAERELREVQVELERTKALLEDCEGNYSRSSSALRMLSGRVAVLEGERARLDVCADAFDKERSEKDREVAELMERLAAAGYQIIGLEDVNSRLQDQSSKSYTSDNASHEKIVTCQENGQEVTKPSIEQLEGHPSGFSECNIGTFRKESRVESSHQPGTLLVAKFSLLGAAVIGGAAIALSSWLLAV